MLASEWWAQASHCVVELFMCSLSIISDDIGGEITRLRLVGVSNVGSGRPVVPEGVPRRQFREQFRLFFVGDFSWRQSSLTTRRLHSPCVRSVFPFMAWFTVTTGPPPVQTSVNSSGNKFSILHTLQMESSRPDGNKASLLPIFISVRADISFDFKQEKPAWFFIFWARHPTSQVDEKT